MTFPDDFVAKGLIEPVEADQAVAALWLEGAGRHIEAAAAIASMDPSGAHVLCYDAARKSVAAAMLQAGYRVGNVPGSHQAITQYARSLDTAPGGSALSRLDHLRRNRNRSEYGARIFGAAEVEEAMEVARAILGICTKRVRHRY